MITRFIQQTGAGNRWAYFTTSGAVEAGVEHNRPEAIVALQTGLTKLIRPNVSTYAIEASLSLTTRDLFLRECAYLVTNLGGADNDLHFIANDEADGGDDISVTYVNPGGTLPLGVVVTGRDIVVNLATSGGSIISTAADIKTLLSATGAVTNLVRILLAPGTATGAGVVTAMSHTHLTGSVLLLPLIWNRSKLAGAPFYVNLRPAHDSNVGACFKCILIEVDRDLVAYLCDSLTTPAAVALPFRAFTLGAYIENGGRYLDFNEPDITNVSAYSWETTR